MASRWEILLFLNALVGSFLAALALCFLLGWLISYLDLDLARRSKPSRSRKPKKE